MLVNIVHLSGVLFYRVIETLSPNVMHIQVLSHESNICALEAKCGHYNVIYKTAA